jgi:hypothetical protein
VHPRAVAALVIAISAFLLATAAARSGLAQSGPAPSARAVWTMPTSLSTAPTVAYAAPARAYVAPAPAYTGQAPSYTGPASAYGAPAAQHEKPAPESAKPRDYHFDLGAGTEVPVSVGGVLTAELPHRFLLQLGVGVLPRAYADAIDGFLTSVGAYDAVVSQIVRGSLGNSAVVRASIGGRPFTDHGFEILGGYTLITGGGAVATTELINAVLIESGASFQAPAGLAADIPIGATLHNFHASVGWRWLLAEDRLVIRASISYIQTVASRIDVKIPASLAEVVPYQGLINEQVNTYLGPYFSKYAKAPTLGLSAAIRF